MTILGHILLWLLSVWALVHGILLLTHSAVADGGRVTRRRAYGAALLVAGVSGLTLPGSALLAAIALAFRNV
jgi:hypothetical protein